MWGFRFTMYLKHATFGDMSSPNYLNHAAPLFGDYGTSYILNMPLIWRFRLIIHAEHNPHLAIPAHHIS